MGASDYLFGAKELREKSLIGGYTCLPICKDCLEKRTNFIKYGGKCQVGERRERKKRVKVER